MKSGIQKQTINVTQDFVGNLTQYNDTAEDGKYYFAYATER